jgi:hypothetical protein
MCASGEHVKAKCRNITEGNPTGGAYHFLPDGDQYREGSNRNPVYVSSYTSCDLQEITFVYKFLLVLWVTYKSPWMALVWVAAIVRECRAAPPLTLHDRLRCGSPATTTPSS